VCGNLPLVEAHDSGAVVLVDTTGTIRYWSAGATTLFGVRDPVGETLDVIVPPEFRDRHWTGFRRAMATGESTISGGRQNIPVRCADGQTRSFPGTFSVLWDAHGLPIGAIAAWSQRRGDETPFSPISPSS
jgi:PAS domain S-box-containing protein